MEITIANPTNPILPYSPHFCDSAGWTPSICYGSNGSIFSSMQLHGLFLASIHNPTSLQLYINSIWYQLDFQSPSKLPLDFSHFHYRAPLFLNGLVMFCTNNAQEFQLCCLPTGSKNHIFITPLWTFYIHSLTFVKLHQYVARWAVLTTMLLQLTNFQISHCYIIAYGTCAMQCFYHIFSFFLYINIRCNVNMQ